MPRTTVVLTDAAGRPMLIEAQVRQSEYTPSRLKVAFTAGGKDGLGIRKPNGEIEPMAPKGTEGEAQLCPEFRLELN